MSSTTRDGTDAAIHFHIWRGVLKENGDLTQRNRISGYWRTRSSANQWLRKAGRRGVARPKVEKCEDLGTCRAKPFDASLQHKSSTVDRLTQGFVDQVKANGQFPRLASDGGGLTLYVRVTKDGGLVRRWLFRARLQGKSRHLRLGSAEVLTLDEARVVAAKVGVEFEERRRLLKEGLDNGETHAAFLTRMQQIAADAGEVGKRTDT